MHIKTCIFFFIIEFILFLKIRIKHNNGSIREVCPYSKNCKIPSITYDIMVRIQVKKQL